MSASYHQVVDNGFWEHLALLIIFVAISAVANGWVGIISTPFTIAVIVGTYFVAGGTTAVAEPVTAVQAALVNTTEAPVEPTAEAPADADTTTAETTSETVAAEGAAEETTETAVALRPRRTRPRTASLGRSKAQGNHSRRPLRCVHKPSGNVCTTQGAGRRL